VDRADKAYFRNVIQPLLSRPNAEFIGEINDAQKAGFLSGARGYCSRSTGRAVWPGDDRSDGMWHTCERVRSRLSAGVIAHGATGYIVDDVPAAVDAVARLDALSRTESGLPSCAASPR